MAANIDAGIPTPTSGMPHLESLERIRQIPVVEAAFNQGLGVYGKVKGANSLFNWALSTAEATLQCALTTASPLVQKLDGPIQAVDKTLVMGIDSLEARVPMVKEQPQQIYETAKSAVAQRVQPTISKVSQVYAVKENAQRKAATLRELSWCKANEVLATQYGQLAVAGVDTTSAVAERLIDYYFPAREEEKDDENDTSTVPVPPHEDAALHTVQTVGRLSNMAARRIYNNVSQQLKTINASDIREYIASLIAVLQLTQQLQLINERVQGLTVTKADTQTQSNGNSNPSTSEHANGKVTSPTENGKPENVTGNVQKKTSNAQGKNAKTEGKN